MIESESAEKPFPSSEKIFIKLEGFEQFKYHYFMNVLVAERAINHLHDMQKIKMSCRYFSE